MVEEEEEVEVMCHSKLPITSFGRPGCQSRIRTLARVQRELSWLLARAVESRARNPGARLLRRCLTTSGCSARCRRRWRPRGQPTSSPKRPPHAPVTRSRPHSDTPRKFSGSLRSGFERAWSRSLRGRRCGPLAADGQANRKTRRCGGRGIESHLSRQSIAPSFPSGSCSGPLREARGTCALPLGCPVQHVWRSLRLVLPDSRDTEAGRPAFSSTRTFHS